MEGEKERARYRYIGCLEDTDISQDTDISDASKAFDRVNKLESRGVPTYILRLLSNELIGQYTCVRWGSTHSEFFPIGNGVKQGGILYHPYFLTFTSTILVYSFTGSP